MKGDRNMNTFKPEDILVVLEGGLVQSVCIGSRELREQVGNAVVIDYDTEVVDADEIVAIPQPDRTTADAVVHTEPIGEPKIGPGCGTMKTTVGKTLYVNVERVSLVDGFERSAPYCQMTGERQVMIDAECFETGLKEGVFNQPPELRCAARQIALKVEEEQPNDINIYC